MKTRFGAGCFLFILLSVLPPVFAKVSFRGLDLSDDNRLLFRADLSGGGALPQHGLFISRLTDLALRQITAFPEKMELVSNGRILQVRNAFGALRIPLAGGLPQGIPGFPSFAAGVSAVGGRVEDLAASQNGRWVLYVEPVSPAYGNLVLIDVNEGNKRVVARNVERSARFFPACWSPDSRVFVYSRGGELFYYPVHSTAPADERYRFIGEGAINRVAWSRTGDFYYLRDSTVYRVRGSELFARALYADFLEIGTLAGKLPFEFDENFDAFWIAPDSRSLLLSKGGRNVFYYPLDGSDLESVLPYVIIPRSAHQLNVLWSPSGVVTVIASVLKERGSQAIAWRLETGREKMSFIPLNAPVGFQAALSPDGSKALFWGEGGVVLYDYINWRFLLTLGSGSVYSCLWISNEEFIAGDSLRIERVKISGPAGEVPLVQRTMLCLSGASEYGFEEKGSRIFAKNNGTWFVSDGQGPWEETANPVLRRPSQVSGRYRVYLEPQSAGFYENLPMIRNTASVGTASLLPGFPGNLEERRPPRALSVSRPETSPRGVFTHGPREGLREAALCFDLYDDSTGLPQVLDALNRFGVRATFFLNGEFIRRYPEAARDIAAAGHEAASLFFAPINLSDARYLVGDDFIARGLARNEDEYYQASGAELRLLWHAPFFNASAEIAAAASRAGYLTVGRDVDPLDWVSREDARNLGLTQYSASAMIDRIMNLKQPGSIIPIRLGLLPGGRRDYLYLRIEVLLDALIRDGYSVVPVSTIIDHSR
jgi:peptidoglycan/xylan/chitin deacetylase (PgdA/CDA1 family)